MDLPRVCRTRVSWSVCTWSSPTRSRSPASRSAASAGSGQPDLGQRGRGPLLGGAERQLDQPAGGLGQRGGLRGVAPAGPVHRSRHALHCDTCRHFVTLARARHRAAGDDALLDAARASIVAVGWRRSTLTDVARRAGVSRMTIYRRWPDMQSLVADLMTREWSGLAGEPPTTGSRPRAARRRGRRDRGRAARQRAVPQDRRRSTPSCCCPTCSTAAAAPRTRCSPCSRPASPRASATARCATATRPCWPARCCSRPTASPVHADDDRRTGSTRRGVRRRAAGPGGGVPPAVSGSPALAAVRRERELAEATDGRVVDLLVVGLGVTGAGVALDAASRGLSVVAVDAHDLAFGTSRWSSKLVHGGLRYLANGQVGVAHESAVERGLLMTRTAPHLTRALPMLIPLLPRRLPAQARVDPGRPGRRRPAARSPPAPRATCCPGRDGSRAPRRSRLVPGLRADGLRGGLLSWDGQLEDDARLVVGLARTAAVVRRPGPHPHPRHRAVRRGRDRPRRDSPAAPRRSAPARSSTPPGSGPAAWCPASGCGPRAAPTWCCGPAALDGLTAAVMAPVPGRANRFVFALPQPDGRVYVGLTDEPVDGDVPDVPVPTDAEIDFLLDVIGRRLRATGHPRRRGRRVRRAAAAARRRPRAARPPTCPAGTPC